MHQILTLFIFRRKKNAVSLTMTQSYQQQCSDYCGITTFWFPIYLNLIESKKTNITYSFYWVDFSSNILDMIHNISESVCVNGSPWCPFLSVSISSMANGMVCCLADHLDHDHVQLEFKLTRHPTHFKLFSLNIDRYLLIISGSVKMDNLRFTNGAN